MLLLEEKEAQTRAQQVVHWYEEVFPPVARYIQQRGGSLDEAKEIFQEALVLFYEKKFINDFMADKDDSSYLMGIAKKRWLKYHEREKHKRPVEDAVRAEEKDQEPQVGRLLLFLEHSGQRCMDILQTFYFENLSMKELAKRFGYRSERSATVQKYKCLEKVRDIVKQNSVKYEDFFN